MSFSEHSVYIIPGVPYKACYKNLTFVTNVSVRFFTQRSVWATTIYVELTSRRRDVAVVFPRLGIQRSPRRRAEITQLRTLKRAESTQQPPLWQLRDVTVDFYDFQPRTSIRCDAITFHSPPDGARVSTSQVSGVVFATPCICSTYVYRAFRKSLPKTVSMESHGFKGRYVVVFTPVRGLFS